MIYIMIANDCISWHLLVIACTNTFCYALEPTKHHKMQSNCILSPGNVFQNLMQKSLAVEFTMIELNSDLIGF